MKMVSGLRDFNNRITMRLNVLFGGKAGQGIDSMSFIISESLVKEGFYVFNYRDYRSLIEGGHCFNVLSISDEKVDSHESELNCIVALDEDTVEKHKDDLKDDGILLKEDDFSIPEEFKSISNAFMAGVLFKTLGLHKNILKNRIKEKFSGKEFLEKDLEAVEAGYEEGEEMMSLKRPDGEGLKIMTGSHAIARGAVESGMDVYFGYPMTPMTPVLHELAGMQTEENILVFQPENELAVVNAGLGAAHTGAKTMVGSSGGGYDLMQEGMSKQGITEIPLVVYLSQRPGPSSGIPTYMEQADLDIAAKGSHGEFPRVTIAPGDARECIRKTNEAFYFAEKFRALSVILGDKHVGESGYTFEEEPETVEVERNIEPDEGGFFDNYKLSGNGNSPRSIPQKTIAKSTSYIHDERGVATDDPGEAVNKSYDKLKRKEETIEEEVRDFEMYKVYGDGESENLVIGWGSTKGAIKDAIEGLPVKFIQILYLRPFPTEIEEELEDAENIMLVENNATGLLGNLIREKTTYPISEENKILKYNGRPFLSDELREKMKRRLQNE